MGQYHISYRRKMYHFSLSLALLSSLFFSAGCGKKVDFLKNVLVQSFDRDGDVYAGITVSLDMGNVALPSITFPILDPSQLGRQLGEVSFRPAISGLNEIYVAVNLTEALKVSGGQARLPNNRDLPIGGLGNAAVVSLPIGNTGATIYLAADQGVALFGFALTFREFDQIANIVGGLNLFFPFAFDQVRGVAGFFTGQGSRQSGLGVFIDIGQVFAPSVMTEMALTNVGTTQLALESKSSIRSFSQKSSAKKFALKSRQLLRLPANYDQSTLQFIPQDVSGRKQQKFDEELLKLHRRKAVLRIR